jgi:TonB family protein
VNFESDFLEKARSLSVSRQPGWGVPEDIPTNLRAEPAIPAWDSVTHFGVWPEPVPDANQSTERLPLFLHTQSSSVHVPTLALSAAIHLGGLGIWMLGPELDLFHKDVEPDVVEVTFGVEVPAQLKQSSPSTKTAEVAKEEPEQATKLPEQLPQLPQRFEVDTKQPAQETSEMPLPEEQNKSVGTPPPSPTPTPTPIVTPTPSSKPDPKAIVAPERDKDARKLDINEVIDRMKREDRKVADKDKQGVNKIPESPFSKKADIPPNPVNDLNKDSSLPPMPDSLAPSGSLAGRKLAGSALEAYRTAALVHMKRNWNIPGVYSFPAGLETRAAVVVDLFGKIRSLEIDKSSGNTAFDELVLKQIRAAEPFPDFPDNSAKTQKIYMKFNPQSID